jgi:hypothetical protein
MTLNPFKSDNAQNMMLVQIWLQTARKTTESKFLVTKFEFGWCFGMSLEGDCHEVEATPNLEL